MSSATTTIAAPLHAIVNKLSRAQKDAIESLAWGMEHFGSLVTNRHVRRSTMLTLVGRGIAESVGRVAMCDDDGCTIRPEQYREGFRLTDHGVEVHRAVMDDYEKQFRRRCDDAG